MTHRFAIRVYYEDTDMGGIVYHANFLKFIERARSEWVAGLGLDQNAMRDKGIVFAVRRVEADYLLPARYGDDLEVLTTNRLGERRTAGDGSGGSARWREAVRGAGYRGLHEYGRTARKVARRGAQTPSLGAGGRQYPP